MQEKNELYLEEATLEDFAFFYQVKSEAENLYWCGYLEKPKEENLLNFWNKTLKDKKKQRRIYICKVQAQSVGYVYLDRVEENGYEISVAIRDSEAGKGFGREAVRQAVILAQSEAPNEIFAYIREDNIRSQKLFERVGFQKQNQCRLLSLENCDKESKLWKYRYWASQTKE